MKANLTFKDGSKFTIESKSSDFEDWVAMQMIRPADKRLYAYGVDFTKVDNVEMECD